MGALIRIAIGLALVLAGAPLQAGAPWDDHVAEASARFGVPAAWVRRVIAAESGGRTHRGGRPVTSRAGAMGLMQLMPGTWADIRARLGLGDDPYDPRDNILAGTFYLAEMHARFGYPGLFAAYNAGPASYARHLATGAALPAETRAYVARIAGRARVSAPAPAAVRGDAPAVAADGRARIFFPLSGDPR